MNRMYKNHKLLLVTELLFCNNPKVTGQPPPINLFLKTVATVHVNVCVCVRISPRQLFPSLCSIPVTQLHTAPVT